MKSFETAIRKALQPLPKGKCFEIYKLTTEPKECTPLVPSHDGKTTVSHSLILVSVRDDGEIKESHSAFLCGLETYEYITVYPDEKKQTTVYISKVDTTGYPSSKITGRLVRAYLQSLGPCHVHVFARAQPQYLFAKSAHNKAKIPLSDRALVGWWYRLLSDALPSASVSAAWWSVPGLDDASSAMLEIGQGGNRKKQTDITWQYGYPYEKEAAADQVIPRFDDDPKTRVIKHLIDQNTNGKFV
ncbi:histone H3-K56 acetyltransferase [Radiomyces spectabilis]|uniref:histone H3-K56 acetyltransferase n=1 Tax=Radiomyces spectabilis TaxID=64574 RepID=UPI002220FC9F|nr:histone H3-K56 acetyltransferase [Radiomyces spectabilis]KAI8393989.1 histone H3-K56 acetyltransferase [Radiomyces spectabilis]